MDKITVSHGRDRVAITSLGQFTINLTPDEAREVAWQMIEHANEVDLADRDEERGL